jgi:hypothetical protein
MLTVKYINTQTSQEFECCYEECIRRMNAGTRNTLTDAIDKFIEQIASKSPASVPDPDNDPEGWDAWYKGLSSTFAHPRVLKQNWNQYSEQWTSSAGVVPIIEITDIVKED